MQDLQAQLKQRLQGRVCVAGFGNAALGDDGAGVRVVEALVAARGSRPAGPAWELVSVGVDAELALPRLNRTRYDSVLFVDAADFGAAPGSVVLLNRTEMMSRFPQVSTHRLSLGSIAILLEADGQTRVHMLAIQPSSLRAGTELGPEVRQAVEALTLLLAELEPAGCSGGRW